MLVCGTLLSGPQCSLRHSSHESQVTHDPTETRSSMHLEWRICKPSRTVPFHSACLPGLARVKSVREDSGVELTGVMWDHSTPMSVQGLLCCAPCLCHTPSLSVHEILCQSLQQQSKPTRSSAVATGMLVCKSSKWQTLACECMIRQSTDNGPTAVAAALLSHRQPELSPLQEQRGPGWQGVCSICPSSYST